MRGVQARTKWIWRGGLVTAFLVVTGVPALRRCSAENAWNRYVCECCEKSPRFAGNACARDGTNLADNDRWWIRFQFAKDGAGRPLEATHPGAEICARPKGRPEVCWPVKPPSPAPPLEVSTTDLTSGSTELVVRERGPRGTTELGRLDTTYSKGLTTSALCIGVWYTKTIVGTVNKVTFSVEPVGANLKACRGF